MNKTVQYLSDEYLQECKKMSPDQILRFLEDFRKLQYDPGDLVQINIRVPQNILNALKTKAKREGILYQKKIKELITEWVLDG